MVQLRASSRHWGTARFRTFSPARWDRPVSTQLRRSRLISGCSRADVRRCSLTPTSRPSRSSSDERPCSESAVPTRPPVLLSLRCLTSTLAAAPRSVPICGGATVDRRGFAARISDRRLQRRSRRRHTTTTDSDHDQPIFPNMSKDLKLDDPELWVADIIYVPMIGGFVYVATVLDSRSRHIGTPRRLVT